MKTKCHILYLVGISFLFIGLLSLLMCVLFLFDHYLGLSFLLLCGLFFNECLLLGWLLLGWLLLGWLLLSWLLLRRLLVDFVCF